MSLFSLIFAFSSIKNLLGIGLIFGITISLYYLSHLPLSFLLSRLKYPGLFMAAVCLFLPFSQGQIIIFQWHGVSIRQEGLQAVLLISSRFICILTVSLVLFATAPFVSSLKAMRSLGLPSIMIDMALYTYRYLEEIGEMRIKMSRAIKLRGFNPQKLSLKNLRILARLTGTLLIRSYDRSQIIYKAMILRGYHLGLKQQKRGLQGIDNYSWFCFTITLSLTVILLKI